MIAKTLQNDTWGRYIGCERDSFADVVGGQINSSDVMIILLASAKDDCDGETFISNSSAKFVGFCIKPWNFKVSLFRVIYDESSLITDVNCGVVSLRWLSLTCELSLTWRNFFDIWWVRVVRSARRIRL